VLQETLNALGIKPADMIVTLVGFLVLLLILRKWFFRPIGEMINRYEQDMREAKERADAVRTEAEQRRAELEQELAHIAARARDEIQKATEQAHATREEILAQARRDAEELMRRGQDEVRRDQEKALAELRDQVSDLAVEAAESVLRGTLNDPRHRVLLDDFIGDLERFRS